MFAGDSDVQEVVPGYLFLVSGVVPTYIVGISGAVPTFIVGVSSSQLSVLGPGFKVSGSRFDPTIYRRRASTARCGA